MDTFFSWLNSYLFWIISIPVCVGLVMVIKKYFPCYKDDCAVEQVVEKVIEEKTGIKVDLTPQSPEPKL